MRLLSSLNTPARATALVVVGLVTALGVGPGVTAAHAAGHSAGRVAGHAAQREPAGASTFTVVEHALTDTTTDTGKRGDSVGDVLTFANPLFDKRNQHRVGSDNGFCLRTKVGAAYECTWTNTLKGGSLVVTGPFYDAKDSVLAITGGTGKYAGARGEMRLHARNAAGSAYDFAFKVIS